MQKQLGYCLWLNSENYANLVRMLQGFCDLGCCMSIKLHFINTQYYLVGMSEEQG